MKINIINLENNKFTNSEIKIAKFINENTQVFLSISINELAARLKIAAATITRFAIKLNMPNYRSLQLFVNSKFENINHNYVLSSGKDFDKIKNNMRAYSSYAINETINKLNYDDFLKFKELAEINEDIFCFGTGSSSMTANEMSYRLKRIGYNSWFFTETQRLIVNLNTKRKILLVIFSDSGKSFEISKLIETVKPHKNIQIVMITSTQDKNIHEKMDLCVLYNTLSTDERLGSISSVYGQFLIVHIIFLFLYNSNPSIKEDYFSIFEIVDQWNS